MSFIYVSERGERDFCFCVEMLFLQRQVLVVWACMIEYADCSVS
jgi:hypothetical protein